MVAVTNHGVLLEKGEAYFESQAVLNPGCILHEGIVHMFYRAVAPGNYSSIGYATFKDGQLTYRAPEPVLVVDRAIERHGIEDPRVVLYNDTFYLFYVAYDGDNAQVMYATATQLPYFTKRGLISSRVSHEELAELGTAQEAYSYFYHRFFKPEGLAAGKLLWEKDCFMFPRRINGKLALLYRLVPDMQVLFFDDFEQLTTPYWLENFAEIESHTVLKPQFEHETMFIGGGCPPIETDAGWLVIYHAVDSTWGHRTYRAAAALLDIQNPTKVLGRLPYPLFSPEHVWEREGDVPHVVFPSGAVIEGDHLTIYYGAADSCIGSCSVGLTELLQELLAHPV